MNLIIKVLKAGSGDSLLIHINGRNILVDGGASMQYPNNLKIELEEILKKKENLDLVIGTHFDEDHINGLFRLLKDIESSHFPMDFIKRFWFQIPPRIAIEDRHSDDTKIGVAKAKLVETLLDKHNWKEENICFSPTPYMFDDETKLWILSPNSDTLKEFKDFYHHEWEPTKIARESGDYETGLIDFNDEWDSEDSSKSNGSSIAILLEYNDIGKLLLLADSKPSTVVQSLQNLGFSNEKKLKVDYVKLSHHGSRKSLSKELLDIVDCNNFIISTSGSKDNLPNKKTFAHILRHYSSGEGSTPINFIFNYDEIDYDEIFSKKDLQDFNFKCNYSNFPRGYQIEIQCNTPK